MSYLRPSVGQFNLVTLNINVKRKLSDAIPKELDIMTYMTMLSLPYNNLAGGRYEIDDTPSVPMLHSQETAHSSTMEEGGDDVKSAWPLWAGLHTCYNGNYNRKQGRKAERIHKDCLSSDCSLQLENMKLESLVTHLQEHTAELEDQLTQSRNLNNALIEKAEASEIDAVDAKLNLYKILVEAERCVEPATCDQEAIKGIWILVQRWREYKHNIARHFQAQHEANIARPSEVFPPSDLRKGKELALPERQGTELSSGDPGPSTSREAKELALSERQGTELSSGDPGPTTTSGEASVSKIFIPAPLEEFVIDPTFCSSLLLALDFLSFQGIFGSIWFGIKLFFSLKRLIKKLAKEALQTVRIYAFFLKGSSSSGKTGLDSIVTRQDAQEMVKENAHLGALMSNAEELLNKLRLLTKLRRGETRLY
ncbi:hypothetical protein L7F22_058946 [Adiantum nelumboides]|nr:hypothetical protein [Adiantum nelumboides]